MKDDFKLAEIIDITPYQQAKTVGHFDAEVKSVIKELTTCINNYQSRSLGLKSIQYNHI